MISHFCVKDYLLYHCLYKYVTYFTNLPCSKKRKHDTNEKLILLYTSYRIFNNEIKCVYVYVHESVF